MGLYCMKKHRTNPFYKETPKLKKKHSTSTQGPFFSVTSGSCCFPPHHPQQRKDPRETEAPEQDPQANTEKKLQTLEDAEWDIVAEPPWRRIEDAERASTLPFRHWQGKEATSSARKPLPRSAAISAEEENPEERSHPNANRSSVYLLVQSDRPTFA